MVILQQCRVLVCKKDSPELLHHVWNLPLLNMYNYIRPLHPCSTVLHKYSTHDYLTTLTFLPHHPHLSTTANVYKWFNFFYKVVDNYCTEEIRKVIPLKNIKVLRCVPSSAPCHLQLFRRTYGGQSDWIKEGFWGFNGEKKDFFF